MEVLTYVEFNEWLKRIGLSVSQILEAWEDKLVIGDDGIGLLDGDYYYEPETRRWLN